ncbi:MAG TPA: lipoprotein-releasing ABC transporter permease subunit [Steroidobacteraceae bacterium]|nr:lipoprotein-releasing ABC transporter permease subunit [Steroidobacteraceae bacterium]
MTLPLPLFIGLRYVRARSTQFFVSFISWISLLGIGVGVAALITIISVMNGFEDELRTRLLSLASHATLTGNREALSRWPELVVQAQRQPGVAGAAPYIELQALVAHEPELQTAVVRGVDPAAERSVSDIGRAMVQGRLEDLEPNSGRIILGRVLAYQLAVGAGDSVTVMIPVGGASGTELQPRIQRFTVSGIFEVGLQDHDSLLALVHLSDAQALRGSAGVSGLRLRFADVFAAPQLAAGTAVALGGKFRVRDWTQENASYFRAIRIEKTMMTLILLLIVAVAAFNIVATLVMVVTDKRTDIAILRTIGARPGTIVGVFMTQGVVIGWLGTAIGLLAGITIALNVATLAPFLERTFGFQFMDRDVYYITQIPSDLQTVDVVLIGVVAFLLTVLATIYPAVRAARTEPAEALRYE